MNRKLIEELSEATGIDMLPDDDPIYTNASWTITFASRRQEPDANESAKPLQRPSLSISPEDTAGRFASRPKRRRSRNV